MIARIWHGVTPESKADQYFEYLNQTGLKDYRSTPGNRGVVVLRRVNEARGEFLLISFWDSIDAIHKFAGPEINKAVYYPEDAEFLLELEPHVTHFDVLVHPSGAVSIQPAPSETPMKHSIYFAGKVQSLSLKTEEGYATVGVITPGQYAFSTESEEQVQIITGTLRVRLLGQDWIVVGRGEKYVVPAKSSFEVAADADVSYICYYEPKI